ncbi:MAG: hypothetical protein HXS44_17465 [Theionarchaea archaeon]|nr:hypothetical protein [Theionarchaea archaeon]
MQKREWIVHIEFLIVVALIGSFFYFDAVREIPVRVEIDASSINNARQELTSEIDQLYSLHDLYRLSLEDLRNLSPRAGIDRLSSEEAAVGRIFYINGEPFYYYVSLKEYMEADFNIKTNSASLIDKSYIRPLTADIEFLARQFVQRYPDKTQRALAILTLIQNLGFDENESNVVKHPTVTLMRGGVCIDLVIACGALLKAADINCAILIFKNQRHAAIGITDIDLEKFGEKITEDSVIEFEGQTYLICETTSLRHAAGDELKGTLGSINAETVTDIIPYEFP